MGELGRFIQIIIGFPKYIFYSRTKTNAFVGTPLVCYLVVGRVVLVSVLLDSINSNNIYIVKIFDELFRSEGVQKVYGIVTEWLADPDEAERKKIK